MLIPSQNFFFLISKRKKVFLNLPSLFWWLFKNGFFFRGFLKNLFSNKKLGKVKRGFPPLRSFFFYPKKNPPFPMEEIWGKEKPLGFFLLKTPAFFDFWKIDFSPLGFFFYLLKKKNRIKVFGFFVFFSPKGASL